MSFVLCRVTIVAGLVCLPCSALAADAEVADKVDQANAKYDAGEYEEALELYSVAAADCTDCPQLDYNQGLAYYRMRDFESARRLFNAALLTQDVQLEQRAKYNLGNVAYSQALEKMSNIEEAIGHARRAIDYYRDALELNPDDRDARANIEIAQLLIKDLLDKQKQEQEKRKQDQKQQQQQEEQKQNQQQDQQSQDEQDKQDEKGEGDKQEQEEKQEQQDQSGQGDQQKDEQQQQQQGDQQQSESQAGQEQQASAQEARELTEEEARRLLQQVRDKEARRRAELARRRQGRRAPVKKDW